MKNFAKNIEHKKRKKKNILYFIHGSSLLNIILKILDIDMLYYN